MAKLFALSIRLVCLLNRRTELISRPRLFIGFGTRSLSKPEISLGSN